MKSILLFFTLLWASVAWSQSTDSLRRQIQLAKHDSTRLKLYCRLGNVYYSNNYNDSLYRLLQQALPLANANQPKANLARIYYLECLYYRSQGLSDKSIESARKALPFFQQTGNTLLVASTLYTLATLYVGKGDLKLAISQSIRTLEYAETYKDIHHITGAYSLLIDIYRKLHNEPLALFYTNQYIQAAGHSEDFTVRLVGYQLKAEIFDQQGKYEQAWPYWQQSLAIARKSVYKANLGATLLGVVANLRKRGRLPQARRYLAEAFQAARQDSAYSPASIPLLEEQAFIDLQLGHSQAALEAARKAVRLMRVGKAPVVLSHCLTTLATIEEATGHYQQALQTYKEYQTIQDSLTSVEKTQQIAQIQAAYDLDKKESTILLLNKNAQVQRQELTVVTQQRLLLGMGALVLLLAVGITSYFLRKINQQKALIQQQVLQLQSALKLRDKLFAILSHDLRSPVVNLLFSLQQLQRSHSAIPDLPDLERQVSDVFEILDNLLYWSLGQQGRLQARLVSFLLRDLVEEVLKSFDSMIKQKGLQIHYVVDQAGWAVLADEKMSQITVRNIVHNAIKYSPVGGTITLTVEATDGQIQLRVVNTVEALIDTASALLTDSIPASDHGTGLGLPVSAELMRQNQGSLSIASFPGKGTTVLIRFKPATS